MPLNELDREMIVGENVDESQKEVIRYPDSAVYIQLRGTHWQ